MAHEPATFSRLWENALYSRRSDRLDSTADREFWVHYARHYDERTGGSESESVTLDYLRSLVVPTDSLLDVGAGTGRFALPLSCRVGRITAVDHSSDMLEILARKARNSDVGTIEIVQAEWPNLAVEPHDVVLAAWSLYRSVDIRAALSALVAATRRILVVILGVGDSPPHRAAIEELCGSWNEQTIPGHLYVAGSLWEMGLLADTHVLTGQRRIEGESPVAIARKLAPLAASDSIVTRLAAALEPHIGRLGSQLAYSYAYRVGVVTWRASG